jgi:hypothetical protein
MNAAPVPVQYCEYPPADEKGNNFCCSLIHFGFWSPEKKNRAGRTVQHASSAKHDEAGPAEDCDLPGNLCHSVPHFFYYVMSKYGSSRKDPIVQVKDELIGIGTKGTPFANFSNARTL